MLHFSISQLQPLWASAAETAEFSGARSTIGLEAAPVAPNETRTLRCHALVIRLTPAACTIILDHAV